MKFKLNKLSMVAAALAVAACSNDDTRVGASPDVSAGRDTAGERYAAADVDADNTGRNVRDRDTNAVTPIDQSNSESDLALTQMIRRGITSNDSMSVQARNVKVISQQGVVTLRGPVKNQAEREAIESLAKDAGATRIDNQLEIDRDDVSGEEG